jgi:L-lactate utilization protein LutC
MILPIIAMAGLEGKRTYHSNNLDQKVEFSQRHNENPFGTTAHKKDPLKKVTNETKTKLHNVLNQPDRYKKLKLEQKHIELQKTTEKKKILTETKQELKQLKFEVEKNSKKSRKKKIEKEKLRKKGYRR